MARSLVDTLYTNSAIVYTIAATPKMLRGIEEIGVDPAVTGILNYAAGDPKPSFTAVNQIDPSLDFTITDIANALAFIDHEDGLAVSNGTDTLDFYLAKKKKMGSRELAATATHMKFSSKMCLTYLEEISAMQGQDATARFRVHTSYDGTNEPITITSSVTLPSGIPPLTEKFKLGKVLINGVDLPGVTGWTYRTGVVCNSTFAGGDHRPSFAAIDRIEPSLEITTLDVPSYATFGMAGTPGTGVTTLYLYKRLKNSTVELDVTAVHIKITTNANFSRIHMGRLGSRNNDNSSGVVIVTPVSDGVAHAPETIPRCLTMSLASAIT